MEEQKKHKPKIALFSDGGAEPNPGKGGFGVILKYKEHVKEFSKGYLLTTNNRMELMAIIHGLEQIKVEAYVDIYSDSKYIIDAINNGWVAKWQENNWYRNKKAKAVNIDLWEKLLKLMNTHEVSFNWIKGHNGHKENERCDELAAIALNGNSLSEDEEYLKQINSPPEDGKIKNEGDKCRKCNTPVIKKERRRRKIKKNQTYYFEYYFLCPNCNTMYMVEDAKRKIERDSNTLF